MSNKETPTRVRTRFAPSPTGNLHIGSLRTALFSFLYARHFNGQFILRVEDTDQARFIQGAIEHLIEILSTMGLNYDEGLFVEDGKIVSRGDYGPYLQSERRDLYAKYAQELIQNGHAYYCFCNEKRLEELRKEQEALKQPTRYDRKCRNLSVEEVAANLKEGKAHVIRQKVPENGQTIVKDLVYKEIVWDNKTFDDQVLVKSDGFPTYHLAVVIDDHLMEISHIIRGDEWIPSTPKHVLLYKAFGWNVPEFAHLPLLLNKDRTKLSKRQGDVAVEDYLQKGYLKEALLNFVAFMGWNPKTEQEIFTLDELTAQFDLAKVNKAGAIMDVDKLDWLNNLYIRKTPLDSLTDLVLPYLLKSGLLVPGASDKEFSTTEGKRVTKEFLQAVISLEKERLKKLSEIGDRVKYFFQAPAYTPEILIWKKSNLAATKENLKKVLEYIQTLEENEFTRQSLEIKIKEFITENKLENGAVLWPLRVSLSGLEASPGPFELMEVLYLGYGKFEILQRIEQAIKSLN